MNNIISNAEQLFLDIKSDFNSLWSFKQRGETLEIITPFSTLDGSFISVFLTQREDRFIVTDGQNLFRFIIEHGIKTNNKFLEETAFHYGIRTSKNNHFYFKSTNNIKLLSSYVYDLIHFYNAVFNDAFLYGEKEIQEHRFSTKVNRLLDKKIVDNIKLSRYYVIEKEHPLKSVGFSTVLKKQNDNYLWAAMCISGSTPTIYLEHVFRANTCFLYANKCYENEINKSLVLAAIFDDDSQKKHDQIARIKLVRDIMKSFKSREMSYSEFEKISNLDTLYLSA